MYSNHYLLHAEEMDDSCQGVLKVENKLFNIKICCHFTLLHIDMSFSR